MELQINDIKTAMDLIGNIDAVEREMLQLEQAPCPVQHHFGPGIYVRELFMSAGTFAVGHFQKYEHLNVFLQGKVKIIRDDGQTEILQAPMIFTGKPGRKVGMVLEDMVWLNIYATDERDIEVLESQLFDKSAEFTESQKKQKVTPDKEIISDYHMMLAEVGFTHEEARTMSEFEDDQIPFPETVTGVKVSDSNIEGKGLFSTSGFTVGQIIAPARIGDYRTPAGRYTNHSPTPNAVVKAAKNILYFEAIREIKGCCGGLDGEEITIDYRQSVALVRRLACQE